MRSSVRRLTFCIASSMRFSEGFETPSFRANAVVSRRKGGERATLCRRAAGDRVPSKPASCTRCQRMNDQTRLRQLWRIAIVGDRDRGLATERFDEVWWKLCYPRDSLAGPIHAVMPDGHCDYVYGRFAGVRTPDDLQAWLMRLVCKCRDFVTQVPPSTDAEANDQAKLLEMVDALEEASRIVYRKMLARGTPPPSP
jgi:hypothetical protein